MRWLSCGSWGKGCVFQHILTLFLSLPPPSSSRSLALSSLLLFPLPLARYSSGCSVQRCMNLRVSVAPFSTGVDETRERMEDEDIADAEKGLCVFCEGEGGCVCFLGCAYVCV